MPTLSAIAAAVEKKSSPAPTGGGMKLSLRGKDDSTLPPAAERSQPLEGRCLGAAVCGECLPMDWPECDPQRAWEEARHTVVNQQVIVLSRCGLWAWLALAPTQKESLSRLILLHRWPLAGRLTQEAGGLASLSPISPGPPPSPEPPAMCPPDAASNAGSPAGGPSVPGSACV